MNENLKFKVSRDKFYRNANYYLDRMAYVFDLDFKEDLPPVDELKGIIAKRFPDMQNRNVHNHAELFAETIIQIQKLDMNLWVSKWNVIQEEGFFIIAVEYIEEYVCEDCTILAQEWLQSIIDKDDSFPFEERFETLQADFDKTLFGGPTLYHLLEAAVLNDIPLTYIHEQNVFMFGYGKRHVKSRSTTFDVDSIKDTEFTMYKDLCKEFLLKFGFPTPVGKVCFTEEELVDAVNEINHFPLVVKPVSGHKGQGVTTDVRNMEQAKKAFNSLVVNLPEGFEWDGAIAETMVTGTDHRLITVGGRFAAALQRTPAFVIGDGEKTIKELIEIENDTIERLDNARSPLCKIQIDESLIDHIEKQDLTLESIPKPGEQIILRTVANISAGGVSFNVTDKIHPDNVKLAEDISKYFRITCLGIDFLAEDISKSWRESPCNIIEINAGPGVFMHLAPAKGGSINVPDIIIKHFFRDGRDSRIPLFAFNQLSNRLAYKLTESLYDFTSWDVATYNQEGVYVNNDFFCKNEHYDINIEIMLRNPKLGMACIETVSQDILDYGMFFQGADLVILEDPDEIEAILERDLLDGGYVIRISNAEKSIKVFKDSRDIDSVVFEDINDKEDKTLELILSIYDSMLKGYEHKKMVDKHTSSEVHSSETVAE